MFLFHKRRWLAVWQLALFGVVAFAGLSIASAHEGPPFPILMDKPLAGYVVSVWADPDIGEAQFFIIVESPEGGVPREAPRVSMWVEPLGRRLDRVTYETTQHSLRNQMQFEAQPYFDQQDMWNVGFRVTTSSGESQELTAEIESTPPGFGRWDLAIYLFPFVLLGGMWLFAMARRRRVRRTSPETEASPSQESGRDQDLVESNVEEAV